MENNQDNIRRKNSKGKQANCKTDRKNFGLVNYTYADYVILSSTLAFAISEELDDADLALFIVFLSQVSSDLALIRTKRAVAASLAGANQVAEEEEEENVLESVDIVESVDDILVSQLVRNKKRKLKRKKIKKKQG